MTLVHARGIRPLAVTARVVAPLAAVAVVAAFAAAPLPDRAAAPAPADPRAAAAAPDKAAALVQLDPFAAATAGMPACPTAKPPLLTAEEARTEAHVRAERGTRCGMDGSCEPGGAYRRDPEINERVRTAIAGEARFARTSVWLTTTRGWVTLQGCVRSAAQRRALVAFVSRQPGVTRVFDELAVRH